MFVFAVFCRVFFYSFTLARLGCANDTICFPLFVPFLGQIWYKMRKFFPGFVRNLGGIWYKVRKYRSRRLAAEFKKAGKKRPRAIAPGLCLLVYSYLARAS
ncbi:hypothetical protein CJ214_01895 [Peptoniphilus lacrimalis]|nr:hypothetical protein CJ214_01895 [Peptoniphilus lacrimalis]